MCLRVSQRGRVYICVAGCGCLEFEVCNYVFSFGTMCSLTNYSTKHLTR